MFDYCNIALDVGQGCASDVVRGALEDVNECPKRNQSLDRSKPITTVTMTEGGVTTQYDQKIVLLIRRSKASPEAACVI